MRAGHFSMLTVDTYLAGKVSISWYRVLGGGRRVGEGTWPENSLEGFLEEADRSW